MRSNSSRKPPFRPGDGPILREIVSALMDSGMTKEAGEFLQRFPPEVRTQLDYLAMEYLVANQMVPGSLVIEQGRDLLSKGLYDPVIYRVLIRRSAEANLVHAVEDL